jgi:hypothetical protein
VQDHQVILLGGFVYLEVQVGEGGAEPPGGGIEPGRTRLAGERRLDGRLEVDASGWNARSKSSRLPVAMMSML